MSTDKNLTTEQVVWSNPENPIHAFIETSKQQTTVLELSNMTEETVIYECSKVGKVI